MLGRFLFACAAGMALLGCGGKKDPPPPWTPGTVYPSTSGPNGRGLLDRRGLIHAHTPYSHDACDGVPRLAGDVIDGACLDDFRRGLCQARHDFAFLTDHPESFARSEYPDVLLHQPDRGDKLVERDGHAVSNWLTCSDQPPALIVAGCESDTMPVGLEEHLPGTIAERKATYEEVSARAVDAFHAARAVSLVAHTELWKPDDLLATSFDGFEMYNLHANAYVNGGAILEMLTRIDAKDPDLPHPDLLFLVFSQIDTPAYLNTWGTVLARGAHRVTTMATDCHRNSFPQIAPDGERLDSFRRMMMMFSNHLLVRPKDDGTWDDADLKEALRGGRLYGAFEFVGYPQGFEYVAEEGGAVREMGETVSLGKGVRLVVRRPSPTNLDPAAEAPRIRIRLLRAIPGGWDEVAQQREGDLRQDVAEPGVYRAEVRIVPLHLKAYAGNRADLVRIERPWIYANPIYVDP